MPLPELLQLATRIFRESGPEALTMDSLAAASGLSRATVYRQVGSRVRLLERLAEQGVHVGEREDLRARVLAAAAKLFGRAGLDGATVEQIAEEAGVGSASVYRHFGDRKGLVDAFLAAFRPRRAAWDVARAPSGDLAADLHRLVTALLGFLVEHSQMLRLTMLERVRRPDMLGELASSPDRTVHAVAALLRHYQDRGELVAADPSHLAQALVGMLLAFGMGQQLWGLPGSPDLSAAAALVVRIFLSGVAANPPGASKSRKRSSHDPSL